MPLTKSEKASIVALQSNQNTRVLNNLEGGINIAGYDVNKLYKEKLSNTLNIDEPLSTTLKGVKKPPKPKVPKEKKEPSNRGKKASENLSKYRQQVREALELKKKIENKNTLIYDDDDEESEEEEEEVKEEPKPIIQAPPPQPQVIMPDMSKVYNEIDALKKQNKALEERLLFRRDVLGISDMRRNMLIKF
jgi:hypothetical protein